MPTPTEPLKKLAYSIKEAMQITGLGRTTLYSHIASGHLKVTRIGGRTIVPADALEGLVLSGCPKPTVASAKEQ